MTDLELVKRCAELMGIELERYSEYSEQLYCVSHGPGYNPLKDDAQAMALVKKFPLDISRFMNGIPPAGDGKKGFEVSYWDGGRVSIRVEGADLNRAIVQCVAKIGE